uniref:DNA ligase (NAD(+)) n=1 Tax=Attheya septentrionalis TaxID=420275 RepID=A0A7S2UKA7_9STRA|mmetsp:Transcript_29242/g.53515  ORF Transcript_29242/g.53515 Transcript_29242/m.53515 type:complete len:1080 (+) Transcript_29242:1172-4411(+)
MERDHPQQQQQVTLSVSSTKRLLLSPSAGRRLRSVLLLWALLVATAEPMRRGGILAFGRRPMNRGTAWISHPLPLTRRIILGGGERHWHSYNAHSYGCLHEEHYQPGSWMQMRSKRRTMSQIILQRSMTTTTRTTISSATTTITPQGEEDVGFEEFKRVAQELMHHDDLYYYGQSQQLENNDKDATNQPIMAISDEEYDALAQWEADLCVRYPHFLAQWETESTWGKRATRYGGRVGPVMEEEDEDNITTTEQTITRTTPTATPLRTRRSHAVPLLSLDNAMDQSQVLAWYHRLLRQISSVSSHEEENDDDHDDEEASMTLLAEPKLDGLSLSLRYQRQPHNNNTSTPNDDDDVVSYELIWAATRGDGRRGDDVTEAIRDMQTGHTTPDPANTPTEPYIRHHHPIPSFLSLPRAHFDNMEGGTAPHVIEVRGEVILPKSALNLANNNGNTIMNEGVNNDTSQNSNPPTVFANARNAASGILLRRKAETNETVIAQTRHLRSQLRFYAYDVVMSDDTTPEENDEPFWDSGTNMRTTLTGWGFAVPGPSMTLSVSTTKNNVTDDNDDDELLSAIMEPLWKFQQSLRNSDNNEVEVDGAVYKLDSMSLRRELQSATRRAPRWAIAHKFPAQGAVTKLLAVEIQVGRTGALTPVAVLEPVSIAGVNITKASLHNFAWAQSILLSHDDATKQNSTNASVPVGIPVLVRRAGDVIPQVVRRVFSDTNQPNDSSSNISYISLDPPTHCPACGHQTVWERNENSTQLKEESDPLGDPKVPGTNVSGAEEIAMEATSGARSESVGQVLRCGAPHLVCPPRAVGALAHAYSRAGLDIMGLSEARLQHLMEHDLIHLPCDIFRLAHDENATMDKIAALPGWGPKSAQNLIQAASRVAITGVPLSNFIYSLSIRHIGSFSSKTLASTYGDVTAFLSALEARDFRVLSGDDEQEGVKGIGPAVLESLELFSKEPVLVQAAKDLAQAIVVLDDLSGQRNAAVDTLNDTDLPWHGKTVVFTGTISSEMTRTQAQDVAKSLLGAKSTPTSISKSTSILVAGNKSGSKVKKALDLGIRVLDATEFLQLVQENEKAT